MAFQRFFRPWTGLIVFGMFAVFEGNALANMAPPPRPPNFQSLVEQDGPPAAFVLRRDDDEKHSRIIIPRKFLPTGNIVPRIYLPSHNYTTPDDSMDRPQHKAVNAGLLLSTVISGGGLTVVFARRRKVRAAVGVSVITLLLTVALGTVMAAEPPSSIFLPNPAPIAVEAFGAGSQVSVDLVATGNEIVLILGKDAPQPGP